MIHCHSCVSAQSSDNPIFIEFAIYRPFLLRQSATSFPFHSSAIPFSFFFLNRSLHLWCIPSRRCTMRLVLGGFLRPEQKFDSFPMLVAQVLNNIIGSIETGCLRRQWRCTFFHGFKFDVPATIRLHLRACCQNFIWRFWRVMKLVPPFQQSDLLGCALVYLIRLRKTSKTRKLP